MELPQEVKNFIEGKIKMANLVLPWNYPNSNAFHDFQAGYRYNSVTQESLISAEGGFDENWFVICSNYFDDPFIIDVSEGNNGYPVYYAEHGAGSWTLIKAAENINAFSLQLKQIQEVESNRYLFLELLKTSYNLENELWQEVYMSVLEKEDHED